ncbi:MAG: glycine cleavage T C-terminal barrel domain-containing protein [Sulfitobacter sp.]
MTGMERRIDGSKDFIEKPAARVGQDDDGLDCLLVTLEVNANGAVALGFETVWAGRTKTGFTTSGRYGHTTNKSQVWALVDAAHSVAEPERSDYVVGGDRRANVTASSPYEPSGNTMCR